MANTTLNAFLTDPDVEDRRREIAAWFAPNPAPFLKDFEMLRARALARQAGQRARFRFGGFCAAAFFFGPVWFFYRKLWGVAIGITLAMVVIGLLPITSRLGLPLAMALGVTGRPVAVQSAIGKLQAMRNPGQPLDEARLREVGGVSKRAAWISGTIFGLLCLIALAGLVLALIYLSPDQVRTTF